MKKLDKLILKTFIGPFLLTFAVVEFILLVQTIVAYFEDFIGKDLGASIYLQLFSYFCANIVPAALPLALLLSCLMTFGGLGEHKELTAIKSAGISLIRIIQPIFVFVVFIAVGLFFYQEIIIPKANLKLYSLLWDIKQKKPSLEFKEGIFYSGIPNYRIKINEKMPEGKGFKDIIIYNHTSHKGNTDVIVADSGIMSTTGNDKLLVLELFNGSSYTDYYENDKVYQTQKFLRSDFKKSKIIFNLESFDLKRTKEELFAGNKLMKNSTELKYVSDSLMIKSENLKKSSISKIAVFYSHILKHDTSNTELDSNNKTTLDSLLSYAKQKPHLVKRAINKGRNIKSFTENYSERIEDVIIDARKNSIEFHKKFTIPFSCIALFFIGAPLGSIIKKGGIGVPVLISILFFIIMYVMGESGRKWSRDGTLETMYGIWFSNIVLIPFGLFFIFEARRDSNILELDYWKSLFKIKNK